MQFRINYRHSRFVMNELYTTVILPVTTVIMTVVIETLISVTKLMIIMSYGNQKQLTAKQNG